MSTESSNLVSSIDQVSSASSRELELSFESSLDHLYCATGAHAITVL